MFLLILLSTTLSSLASYKDVPVPVAYFTNVKTYTAHDSHSEIASKQNDIVYDQRSKKLNCGFNRMEN